MKVKTDADRALMYLYAREMGDTPEGIGDAELLALIAGWPLERAERALKTNQERGCAFGPDGSTAMPE